MTNSTTTMAAGFSVLSKSAVLIGIDGFRKRSGLKVLQHPASAETCEQITVNAVTYRADAFVRDVDTLTHESGWTLSL